jgi:hypothetical protein
MIKLIVFILLVATVGSYAQLPSFCPPTGWWDIGRSMGMPMMRVGMGPMGRSMGLFLKQTGLGLWARLLVSMP